MPMQTGAGTVTVLMSLPVRSWSRPIWLRPSPRPETQGDPAAMTSQSAAPRSRRAVAPVASMSCGGASCSV
jgi:hypothetical protein